MTELDINGAIVGGSFSFAPNNTVDQHTLFTYYFFDYNTFIVPGSVGFKVRALRCGCRENARVVGGVAARMALSPRCAMG